MPVKFQDIPYRTFSAWSDLTVVCPTCGKAGTVHFDRNCGTAIFQCRSCYTAKTTPAKEPSFEVTAQCTATGKYIRISLPECNIHRQNLRIKCPYCKESVIGNVSAKELGYTVFQDVSCAEDPYFHYPLYFQGSYRGRTIWAYNRAHLEYLIDYLKADLRTVPFDFYKTSKTMRSQSDLLPAFMKTAKNRKGIVKLLTKLQAK